MYPTYPTSSYLPASLLPDADASYSVYRSSSSSYYPPPPPEDEAFDEDDTETVHYHHHDPRDRLLSSSSSTSSSFQLSSSRLSRHARSVAPIHSASHLPPTQQRDRRRRPHPPSVASTSAFSSAFSQGGGGGLSQFGAPSSAPFSAFADPSNEEEKEDEGKEEDAEEELHPSIVSPPSSPSRPDSHRPPPPSSTPAPSADDWMDLDESTTRILTRSLNPRICQMDQETLAFGDTRLPTSERPAKWGRWGEVKAELTDQQRKERLYMLKLQQPKRKNAAFITPRETDLSRLSFMKKAASQSSKPVPRQDLSFTKAFERELQRDRPVLAQVDIEEDSSESFSLAPAQVKKGGLMDELDKWTEGATSAPAVRAPPSMHARKGRKRGGLEDKLEELIRVRQSNFNRSQHNQRQSLHPSPLLMADPQGNYPTLLVKMVAGLEYYSLLFTLCVICSPYKPPRREADYYIPSPASIAIPSTLPSLSAYAKTSGVPLSQLALVLFSSHQRKELRLPSDFSTPSYHVLMFPWFDVGERMGVYGRVLIDVFDCHPFDRQQGEEMERSDEHRRLVEGEVQHMEEEAKQQHSGRVERKEKEEQEQKVLAALGLSEDELARLMEGEEKEERQQLMQRADDESDEAPAKSPSPPPLVKPFSDYRRLSLASLHPFTSLRQTCLVGVIRKASLNGHAEGPPATGSPLRRRPLPRFFIDDGSALVQVNVTANCVKEWSEVLTQGVGKVIWIGGAQCKEEPEMGRGEVDGLSSILQHFGHTQQRGIRVLQVGERSRWRMRVVLEQTALPEQLQQEQRITPLKAILTGEKKEGRITVSVKVLRMQWKTEQECMVWLSDPSLMPSTAGLPPSNCLLLSLHRALHLQLVRAFIYPADPQGSRFILQDLLLISSTPWPAVIADSFTDLLLPHDDLRCEVEGFQQTSQYEQARSTLRSIEAIDTQTSLSLSLPQQLVSPFSLTVSIPPLSSLLTSDALLGQTASPSLQRFGLFSVDGVVMEICGPPSLTRQCPSCGHEAAHVRGERRSPLASFCTLCKSVSAEAHPIVGRVVVEVKCSSIVQLLRVQLSPAVVAECIGEMDGGVRLGVLNDERELRNRLISKRVHCVCVCAEGKEAAVPAKQLQLKGLDDPFDGRKKASL